MIYTTDKLFEALQSVIANLPAEAQAVTIKLRAGSVPEVEAVFYARPDGSRGGPEGEPPTEARKFYLVSEENWRELRQFVAWTDDELARMS